MFYKIGEVSRITGLEPYVLRYWETEFPQINPRKGRGGQREYRREDLDTILAIQAMLRQEGYTISGAKRRLRQEGVRAVLPEGAGTAADAPPAAAGEVVPGRVVAGVDPAPVDELVQKTRKGLQELLQLMENTDSLRANRFRIGA